MDLPKKFYVMDERVFFNVLILCSTSGHACKITFSTVQSNSKSIVKAIIETKKAYIKA
jgi:hypothetical protein